MDTIIVDGIIMTITWAFNGEVYVTIPNYETMMDCINKAQEFIDEEIRLNVNVFEYTCTANLTEGVLI